MIPVGPTPWELYAGHRARLTALLLESAPPRGGALALLGAGRCRDVDLPALLGRFARVHLVDLDAAAVASARARLDRAAAGRVSLHAPVELGGLASLLAGIRERPPAPAVLQALVDRIPGALARKLPAADVVASTCLLSQLSYQVTRALGASHPAAGEVRRALATIHLRTLAALAAGGCTALLASDLAAAPRGAFEARLLAAGPRALVDELVAAGTHFRGTSPPVIQRLLGDDPRLAAEVARVEEPEPWLWTRTRERTYLVYAVRFVTRGPSPRAA